MSDIKTVSGKIKSIISHKFPYRLHDMVNKQTFSIIKDFHGQRQHFEDVGIFWRIIY
jgi:hypothetical protein